ncbi:UTP--glucose-1-phosphate uridylyltransferase [Candidatus Uhrbacteria bacterium]|jgi:UTP--glucose-1-phosphate uridylyltransferase|nr:UTP--glucose-1-phosphate uridylyltransferase [Candidatus Uhrbacteria bacterium]
MKKSNRSITKAIIPVAGIGTRFLPATKAQPKEMLPIVDKPVIQYIVEDMVSAGIKDIIFVTSMGKRALEDHFDRNFELEYRLAQKGKKQELKEITKIGKLANFAFVRQDKPLGDGHAILSALPFVDDDEDVMIMFGDDLAVGLASDLIETFEKHKEPVLGVLEVPKDQTHRYGIIGGEKISKKLWRANSWIEKPKSNPPSNLAWQGSAILSHTLLKRLKKTKPAKDGEIRLAGMYEEYFNEGGTLNAHIIDNVRFDCGNKLEYLKANIYFGMQRPEFKDEIKKYIKKLK